MTLFEIILVLLNGNMDKLNALFVDEAVITMGVASHKSRVQQAEYEQKANSFKYEV